MKKYIITLVVAATAVIHTHAADLADQLLGYWTLDAAQTTKVAEKANREIDGLKLMFMEKKMVYEFQKDQMIIHAASTEKMPAMPYTVKEEDEKAKSLTLSAGGEEMKIRLDKGKMAINDPDDGWMVFNPMSKEDFAKFAKAAEAASGEATLEPEGGEKAPAAKKLEDVSKQPIPDEPAAGKIHGKEFKVEKAILQNGNLKLRQGGGESVWGDKEFEILGLGDEKLDSKTFVVKPDELVNRTQIHRSYKEEGKLGPETEIYLSKFSMKLEFGTAKDGKLPGKIHLHVPDEAESYVIGTFEAEIK